MTLFLQQVLNGLVVGSTYALIALGFALTFNSLRVVNMAHPDIVIVGMFAIVEMTRHIDNNRLLFVLIAVAACLVFSLVLERIVLRPLRRRSHLMTLVATAGVSIAVENALAGHFGPDPVPFPSLLPRSTYNFSGLALSSGQVFAFGASVAMMLLVSYYVRRTRMGRATRAIAERPDVAAAFGVPVHRVAQITISVAALMAALAGLAIGNLYTSVSAFEGQPYALKAFTCMLVAGNRHIEGIVAVGLGLGVAEALTTNYISSNYTDAVAFVLLLIALTFRRSGLFGSYVQYA